MSDCPPRHFGRGHLAPCSRPCSRGHGGRHVATVSLRCSACSPSRPRTACCCRCLGSPPAKQWQPPPPPLPLSASEERSGAVAWCGVKSSRATLRSSRIRRRTRRAMRRARCCGRGGPSEEPSRQTSAHPRSGARACSTVRRPCREQDQGLWHGLGACTDRAADRRRVGRGWPELGAARVMLRRREPLLARRLGKACAAFKGK